ncbi:MAG: mannose-1-phosphate guanylyltransferase [Oscillospiraceae bacterium]|nr:mannose-1-phosphate guanylyltransferase [Oscillospiraceae bacterium]
MKTEIRYIELKTGYHDDGPAWIGKVKLSKSGNTVYFNNKAFRKGSGASGNYYDIETHEEYWISGVKKDGGDRHWAGGGRIILAKDIADDYLAVTGQQTADKRRFIVEDIPESYPIDRINELENRTV